MDAKVHHISFIRAKELLRVNDSTLNNLIKKGLVPIVSSNKDSLGQLLIDEEGFCRTLEVKKLPEKFLTVSEVAKILGITKARVTKLCQENFLPHYRLKNSAGSRLLFIEEEIVQKGKLKIYLESPHDYHSMNWRISKMKDLVASIILEASKDGLLSKMEEEIIAGMLLQTSTLVGLANKYHLTRERMRQIFLEKTEKLVNIFHENNKLVEKLSDRNAELKRENSLLKARLESDSGKVELINKQLAPVYRVTIKDLDLSERSTNCLTNTGIDTLGKLLEFTVNDLLLIRNLGRISQVEILQAVHERGLKFRNE